MIFDLTEKEVAALKAVITLSQGVAELMIKSKGPQMGLGLQIESGCVVIDALINLSRAQTLPKIKLITRI